MTLLRKFKSFFKEYSKALDNREAALFIGAGLSHAAGLKTWPELSLPESPSTV
jgi:hypothetical protein